MSRVEEMMLCGAKKGKQAKGVTKENKEAVLNWALQHGYVDHNSRDVAIALSMDLLQLLATVNALKQDGCLQMSQEKIHGGYYNVLTEKGKRQIQHGENKGTNPEPKREVKIIDLGPSQVLILKTFLNHPSFQDKQRIFSSALVRGGEWVEGADETLTDNMKAGNLGYQLNQLRELGAIMYVDPDNKMKEGCVLCPDTIIRDRETGEIIYPVDRPTATEGLEGVEPPSELNQPAALDKAEKDTVLPPKASPVEGEKSLDLDPTQGLEEKCHGLKPQDIKFLIWFGENYSNYLFPQEKDVEEWNTFFGSHWCLDIFKQKLRESANLGLVERIETPGKGARTRREYKPIENVTTWLKGKFPESDESEKVVIPEVKTGKVPDEPTPVEAEVISTEERVAVDSVVQALETTLYPRKEDDKVPDVERGVSEISPTSTEPPAEQTESPVSPAEPSLIVEEEVQPEESGVVAEEPNAETHVSTEDMVEYKIRLYYQQQKPQGINVSQESAEGAGLTLEELHSGLLSLAERGIMRRTMHQGKMVYVMVDQPEESVSEPASTADDKPPVEVQVHDKVPFLPAIETVDPTPGMYAKPRKDNRCKKALKMLPRHVETYKRILQLPFGGKMDASDKNAHLLGISRETLSRTLSEMAYLQLLGVTNKHARGPAEPMKYQLTHLAAQLIAEFEEREKAESAKKGSKQVKSTETVTAKHKTSVSAVKSSLVDKQESVVIEEETIEKPDGTIVRRRTLTIY